MNKILLFVLVICLCKGLDAFCSKRCGEPWTRGLCETCSSAPCSTCPNYDCGCSRNFETSCDCGDPECECLKARVRFPDVEYPMSILEMKPYFSGCCA
ncbi:unnamed protein product [Danaus chrysippus]|uniref:(African queen) hypothetical protein n=1 Tax=Danaus chrysippus TaxID=151541 RepID=A0A8J2R270_9NEOP|nr:unnamed protein product [Danaus chrysippus]